ncbi:MAG: SMP-30/gluconolactonase/LRE family protein [Chloroflexota bacterium]|nr:SMP-30/gluconolactonase/LRE family protein [Chloroflexota bacterium]
MKARILLVLVIVLVLVVAGCAPLFVTLDDTAPAASDEAVPFKARYQTYPEPVGPPLDGILTLKISADGEGDPLGKSTWYADSQVDLTQVPNLQTGTMAFTAANGDQLFGTFAGESSPLEDGPVSFKGTFQIDGGTGEFEGATGSGVYSGSAEGSEGILEFDGTLSVPELPGQTASSNQVTWIQTYDPTASEFPEGIATDKQGNVFVSVAPLGQIHKISPDGAKALFYQFPPEAQVTGLAVDAPGNLYVCVFTGGTDLSTQGVWRISRTGEATHLPGTENIFLPNALAFDKRGNLYVTDTYVPGSTPPAGAIWRIPRDGEAHLWLQDWEFLGGVGQIPGYPPLGANGISFRHNGLYVASTEKGIVAYVPVLPDGSPGDLSIVAQGPELVMIDGIALDSHGTIFAALVGQDRVVAVDPASGSVTELAGPDDGLDGPASLAFGVGNGERKDLYFTNYAILSQAHPGVLKMDVEVPGMPLLQ